MKVLLADYDEHYAVIELIGEWNDEREKIGNQYWTNAELFVYGVCISNRSSSAIDLHDPIFANALGEIFIRRPDAYFQNTRICGSQVRCRG